MNMKALLILLAIAAGVWLWRRGRHVSAADAARQPPAQPQPMLCCVCCGVHLPANRATLDHQGRAFCCPEHRRQMQGR